VLPCADGKWIALHMSSPPKFWAGLAQAIEKLDLFEDPRFATREQAGASGSRSRFRATRGIVEHTESLHYRGAAGSSA